MKYKIILLPLLFTSTAAFAEDDEHSQYEITNNVVEERAYTLPNADQALNAGLFDNRSASFYRNAANLNAGVLNNARLSADLGERTIASARNADVATRTAAVTVIGPKGTFDRRSRRGTEIRTYNVPEGASQVLVEVVCRTMDNHSDANQQAKVFLSFNAGFTEDVQLCFTSRNHSDRDRQTSSGSYQFDVPAGATQIAIRQDTYGGDQNSETAGNIFWFGATGPQARGLDRGRLVRSSRSNETIEDCGYAFTAPIHCHLDVPGANNTFTSGYTGRYTGGYTGGGFAGRGGSIIDLR